MWKSLQRYVPRDVKDGLREAKAALQQAHDKAFGGEDGGQRDPREAAEVKVDPAPSLLTSDEALAGAVFEFFDDEDNDLCPLSDPFCDEVTLFTAKLHGEDASAESHAQKREDLVVSEEVAATAPTLPKAGAVQAASARSSPNAHFGPLFDRGKLCGGPIVATVLVDFHHIRGPVIEWAHPEVVSDPTESSPKSLASGFPVLDSWSPGAPAEEVAAKLAEVLPLVVSFALPDAAHLSGSNETSSVFFLLPCAGELLYGVACHRRVGSEDLLHRDESVSRSAVQKSVCVLSRCPFFGLVQQRLSPVVHAFFEQKDFRCTTLLSDFHRQLVAVPFENMSESDLLHGLDHTPLLRVLRHKLLGVLKAVLLEAKVLVYAPTPEACSRAVLCLLSLLPGGLWLGFNSDGLGSKHFHFQKHGLPLQCFGPRCCVHPYLGLQMLDTLLQMRGFLVGTTNRMIIERALPDVIVEVPAAGLDGYSVQYCSRELQKLVQHTAQERAWQQAAAARLEAVAPQVEPLELPGAATPAPKASAVSAPAADGASEVPPTEAAVPANPPRSSIPAGVQTFAMDDDDDDDVAADVQADDDEAWAAAAEAAAAAGAGQTEAGSSTGIAKAVGRLNKALHADPPEWLMALMPKSGGAEASTTPSERFHRELEWPSMVDASRAQFSAYWERLLEKTAFVGGVERNFCKGLEEAPREARWELATFGQGFLERWTAHTHSGQAWLQAHRLPVSERRLKPPREGSGVYRFGNGDEYRGEFRQARRHGAGVYASRRRRFQYDGQWQKDRRTGNGTLTVEGADGQVAYTYDGEWLADERHGRGSCVQKQREKYSGQWARNRYHGAGTLVEADGTMYEGEWREGKFHGVGKHSRRGEIYTGEFTDGERHGQGQLVLQSSEVVAASPRPPPRTSPGASPRASPRVGREEPVVGGLRPPPLGSERLFAGQWCNGRRQGQGRAMYVNGEYEGDWLDGLRHGQGIVTQAGRQLEGPWVHDVPNEEAAFMISYPSGAKYHGAVRYVPPMPDAGTESSSSTAPAPVTNRESEAASWWIVPEGAGLMKSPDGQVYDGEHRGGIPCGSGLAIGADQAKFEGAFEQGQRHGTGWLTLPGTPTPRQVHYKCGELLPGAEAQQQAFAPPDREQAAQSSCDISPEAPASEPPAATDLDPSSPPSATPAFVSGLSEANNQCPPSAPSISSQLARDSEASGHAAAEEVARPGPPLAGAPETESATPSPAQDAAHSPAVATPTASAQPAHAGATTGTLPAEDASAAGGSSVEPAGVETGADAQLVEGQPSESQTAGDSPEGEAPLSAGAAGVDAPIGATGAPSVLDTSFDALWESMGGDRSPVAALSAQGHSTGSS